MRTLFTALLGLTLLGLAGPSLAADDAECKTKWDTVDLNKDGNLNPDEGVMKDANWQRFDLDHDDKLTTTEFVEGCKADAFQYIK